MNPNNATPPDGNPTAPIHTAADAIMHPEAFLASGHCLRCGAPPEVVGQYAPDDSQAWGAKPGLIRLFAFRACLSCATRPNSAVEFERIIADEIAGGASCLN